MSGRPRIERLRGVAFVLVGAALVAAIWSQRATVSGALAEMRAMPPMVIGVLIALAVAERATRADIVRRLLGPVTFGRALTIHDVGTAATKGVPLGGPLATALRWSIARDAAVPTSTFASALVDPGAALLAVRDTLRSVARRPTALLARTVVAQSCSAVILLVALRGLGVGSELATLEFLRVYFVVTLLTYVTPIVVGASLYAVWRLGVRSRSAGGLGASPVPARSVS